LARIVSVIPNDDHTLLIELDNHHRIIYDMRPKLQTVRFSRLRNLARFKAVRVEHANTLVWNSICRLTIDEIVDMLDR
jgi:hypothetical protein